MAENIIEASDSAVSKTYCTSSTACDRRAKGNERGREVTVDEQLVPFRGCCPFWQYMPSKPAKYGIKTWVACDGRFSYAWKMRVYAGREEGEGNRAAWIVLDLTEGLLSGAHNVTRDNFFTSYELARWLLEERGVTLVGTVRRTKPWLPPTLTDARGRAPGSCELAFSDRTALVSYVAEKPKGQPRAVESTPL